MAARNMEDDVAKEDRELRLREAAASVERQIAQIQAAQGAKLSDEEISRQLLYIEDTMPFNYSLASITEKNETPVLKPNRRPSPSLHRDRLAALFSSWCKEAAYTNDRMKSGKLPSMFRFALQRPLMPESTLQKTLAAFDIDPTLSYLSEMRVVYTIPLGRDRRTVYGLEPDLRHHVSQKYRNKFPKGLSLLYRGQQSSGQATAISASSCGRQMPGTSFSWGSGPKHRRVEFGDRQTHDCLWSLYDLIQDGTISLEDAPDRYRDILAEDNTSNSDLILHLETLQFPTHHIETAKAAEWKAYHHTSHEKDTIEEIAGLINLYTSGDLHHANAIALIKEALAGLLINDDALYKSISRSDRLDAALIAEEIWEEAAEEEAAEEEAAEEEAAEEEPANSQQIDMLEDKLRSRQAVSGELAEICEDVRKVGSTGRDAIAMIQTAIGEHESTSTQKSHISQYEFTQAVAYRRIFANDFNEGEEVVEVHSPGLPVASETIGAGDLLTLDVSRQDSRAPDIRLLLESSSTEVISTAGKPQTFPPQQRKPQISSLDTHIEEARASPLFKEISNSHPAYDSNKIFHKECIYNAPPKLQSAIVLTNHESGWPLNKSEDPINLMPPPKYCTPLRQMTEVTDTLRSSSKHPVTPLQKFVAKTQAAGESNQQKAIDSAWRRFMSEDEKYDSRLLLTSPEKGMTCSMFGLDLPTKEARKLGLKIGLPRDYTQEHVHSKTVLRAKIMKFRKASTNVTFPVRKQYVPYVTSSSRCGKLTKRSTVTDLFAFDSEDHEQFISKCFTAEVLKESSFRCSSCQQLQCACRKRKRFSACNESSSRKKQQFNQKISGVPEMTQHLMDAISMSNSSLVGPESDITEAGPPGSFGSSAPPPKPVKLRLNPPKPPTRPKLSSPSSSPRSPSSESILSLSTPFTSPSPPRSPMQLKPPKALMSRLLSEVADNDMMDTLRRLGKAKSAEGVRIYKLLDNALHLTRQEIHRESEVPGARDFSEAQVLEHLRRLIVAQLQLNQRNAEPKLDNPSSSDTTQKVASPLGELSTAHSGEPLSSSSITKASESGPVLHGVRPALMGPDRMAEDFRSSNAMHSITFQMHDPSEEPIPSIESNTTPDELLPCIEMNDLQYIRPAKATGHREALRYMDHSTTDRPRTPEPYSTSMVPESASLKRVSEFYKSKDKEMTKISDATSTSMPRSRQASSLTSGLASRRDPSKRHAERKRTISRKNPRPRKGVSTKDAIDKAHREAVAQGKSIFLYMAEQRLIRPRADRVAIDRFFQGVNHGPSSGSGSTLLNKLFDKYRGNLAMFPWAGSSG